MKGNLTMPEMRDTTIINPPAVDAPPPTKEGITSNERDLTIDYGKLAAEIARQMPGGTVANSTVLPSEPMPVRRRNPPSTLGMPVQVYPPNEADAVFGFIVKTYQHDGIEYHDVMACRDGAWTILHSMTDEAFATR